MFLIPVVIESVATESGSHDQDVLGSLCGPEYS